MMHDLSSATTTSHATERTSIVELLDHIGRALSAMLSVAHQIIAGPGPRHAVPLLFERVDFHARRAEEAMRELRDCALVNTNSATELSQSLTVIILVADMVVSGHLAPTSLGDEELFLRNIARAETSLDALRSETV